MVGSVEDKARMEELRTTIAEDGLENPLRLRPVTDENGDQILQIVNGERRLRTIQLLCQDNVECYDSGTETMRPARVPRHGEGSP